MSSSSAAAAAAAAAAAGRGSTDLSAAAQEALGFADDQFMELSTSGASILNLSSLLTDPLAASSSGRFGAFQQASAAGAAGSGSGSGSGSVDLSTSNSLRRFFLASTAAAGRHASRDESSLSMSGMSLASLGSLSRSRSTKRLGGLFDVDEALDDSRAWRNYFLLQHGPAGLSESGSDVVAELMGKPRAGNPVGAGAEATVAGGARSAEGADAKVEGAGVAAAGGAAGGGGGGGGSGATTAAVVAVGDGDDIPSPPACVDGRGRVQDLSQRVTELRQQSYNRRLMATAAVGPPRGRAAPPPLPVGVNLAPDETPAASPSERKLSPGWVAQRVAPSGGVPGAKAAAVDAGYGNSMLEGSGGGGRGVDSSDGGGKGRVKGRRRKAAASFIRKIGLAATGRQHQQHQSEGGSLESSTHSGSNNHVSAGGAAGGGGAEGSLTSGSWSADSSSQGGAGGSNTLPYTRSGSAPRSTQAFPNSPSLAAPEPLARGASVGLGALAESSSAAAAPAAAESAVKRAGLRGRLGQVWSSRRKVDRRDRGSKERAGELMRPQQQEEQGGAGAGGGSSETSSTCSSMPPAVLQPAGDGGGGFAFLPAAAPLAAPAVAPSSTTAAGNGVIPEVGGGAAPPPSPLGRSFDPNQPLLSGSVDDSNVSLPPQFGTAANSLGASNASFDPNRSTRSWFDTSAESQARVPPEVPSGLWVEPQPQHGALAPLAVEQRAVAPTSRPWSEAERETAAAAAAGIALATGATMSVGSTERGGPSVSISPARQAGGGGGGVEGAVAAAAAVLARPTFDENLLVAELSDLSVSVGGESSGQDGSSVGGMCLGDATGEQQQGRMWPNCAAAGEGEGALAAAAAAADWSRPNQQQREAMQGLRWPAAQQGSVPPNGDTAPAHPPMGLAPQSTGARAISAESGMDPMLGQAPTMAPTLQFSGGSTRSQSVDVGMLSHKGQPGDDSGTAAAHTGWGEDSGGGGDDGRLSRAMGSWPHQGADANVVTRSSRGGGGGGGTRSLSRSGLVVSSGSPLQRSVSVDTSVSGVPHGSHRGRGGGGGGREGVTGAQFASLRALQQEAAGTGGFVPQQQQPALDGDDSMHAPALSGGDGALDGGQKNHQQQQQQQQQQEQQQQRKSWSALHAMIPLTGMGTGAASAAATATAAQEQRRRFTLPLPASGGGGGHDDDGSSRRPSLPTSTNGVFADGTAALAGGGGSDAGSTDGVDGGRRRRLSDRSWRAALPTFRHSKEPAAAGSDTLDMSVQDNMDEMFLKRRLNSSRSLDLSVGNHKKQCLDGLGPPAAPAGESTAAAVPDTSNAAGTTNPTAFEPFDFLRGLVGGGGGSGASASASSSSTVAGAKPPAGVPIAIAPKGDLPSTAGGGGVAGAGGGGAGTPPSPQPPSLGIPQQKQKTEVNPQAKKARQAVAARRPRDRGRFMKSSQKWVTQGELKQTKTTGKPADDGQG